MKDLFIKEKEDLLEDLKGLQRHCAIRKINEMVKRTRFPPPSFLSPFSSPFPLTHIPSL